MKTEKISGGSAVAAQVMVLLFFIPFLLFLSYIIVSKNFSTEGIVFLLAFIGIGLIIIKNAFTYGDIYLLGDKILVKKINGTRNRLTSEYQNIDKSLMPFTFYIEFIDNKKVYFFSRETDVFQQITSSDHNKILKALRLRFEQEKDRLSSPEVLSGSTSDLNERKI